MWHHDEIIAEVVNFIADTSSVATIAISASQATLADILFRWLLMNSEDLVVDIM